MMLNLDKQPCRNTLLMKIEKEGSVERYGRKFEEFETEEEVMIIEKITMIVRYIREIKYMIAELESVIILKMTRRFDVNAAKQSRDLMMQKLQIGA